jgi:hypothetical protein
MTPTSTSRTLQLIPRLDQWPAKNSTSTLNDSEQTCDYIRLEDIPNKFGKAALQPILTRKFGRRFSAGLVRESQINLIRRVLELAMKEIDFFTFQFSAYLEPATRSKLFRRASNLEGDRLYAAPAKLEAIGGLKRVVDDTENWKELDQWAGHLVMEDAPVKYRTECISKIMAFIVKLRSESIEERILKYINQDSKGRHRCIGREVYNLEWGFRKVCYICG